MTIPDAFDQAFFQTCDAKHTRRWQNSSLPEQRRTRAVRRVSISERLIRRV